MFLSLGKGCCTLVQYPFPFLIDLRTEFTKVLHPFFEGEIVEIVLFE